MSTKSATPNPLAVAAAKANREAVTAAIKFESAAEVLEDAFRSSAKAFAAARADKVSVASLAKAVKDEAGESSFNLHGVQFFTSNAAVVAHAFVGEALNKDGDLKDGVSARDFQTLALQTYNREGGNKVLAAALKVEGGPQDVFDFLKNAAKVPPAPKDIATLLAAASGPLTKALTLVDEGEDFDADAMAALVGIIKTVMALDSAIDKPALADEAADLAELSA